MYVCACACTRRKIAFQTVDREYRKRIQSRLRAGLRTGQRTFKDKLEKHFGIGRMRDAWEGLKTPSGEIKRNSDNYLMTVEERRSFSNDLNHFYCHFERDDLDGELNSHAANRGRV